MPCALPHLPEYPIPKRWITRVDTYGKWYLFKRCALHTKPMLANKADQLFDRVGFDGVTVLEKRFRKRSFDLIHVFEQHITIDEQTTWLFLGKNPLRKEMLHDLLRLATRTKFAHSLKKMRVSSENRRKNFITSSKMEAFYEIVHFLVPSIITKEQ